MLPPTPLQPLPSVRVWQVWQARHCGNVSARAGVWQKELEVAVQARSSIHWRPREAPRGWAEGRACAEGSSSPLPAQVGRRCHETARHGAVGHAPQAAGFKWTPAPHVVIQAVTGGLAHCDRPVRRGAGPRLPAGSVDRTEGLCAGGISKLHLQVLEFPGPKGFGSLHVLFSLFPLSLGPGASPSLMKNCLSLSVLLSLDLVAASTFHGDLTH